MSAARRRRDACTASGEVSTMKLTLIPGKLTLADLRRVWREPVELTLDPVPCGDRRRRRHRGPSHRRRPRRLRRQHRLRAAGQPADFARGTGTVAAQPRALACRRRRPADERAAGAAAAGAEDQQPRAGLFGRPPDGDRGARPAVEPRGLSLHSARKARAGRRAIWPRWPT